MTVTLTGRLRELSVTRGWGRGVVVTTSGKTLNVVGSPLVGLNVLRTYELIGQYSDHPIFGKQFKVQSAQLRKLVDRDALIARLEADFSGCGSKTAQRIVSTFQTRAGGLAELADLLDTTPWELEADEEATGKTISHLATHALTDQQRVERSLQVRAPTWIHRDAVGALARWALQRGGTTRGAMQTLRADPWLASRAIDTLRFPELDAMGEGLRANPQSRSRAICAVVHLIDEARQEGHTGLPKEALRQGLSGLLGYMPTDLDRLVDEASEQGFRVTRTRHAVYDADLQDIEARCAKALRARCTQRLPLWLEDEDALDELIEQREGEIGLSLDAGQATALRRLLESSSCLHTLCAGPGAGKTTVMEFVAAAVPEAEFAAPTGKAARVLSNRLASLGRAARTVHSLLEATPNGFRRDHNTPLQGRLVVVDEAGMLDVHTLYALLDACPIGMHLLLVGDPDQLESVGPGGAFQSVLALPQADHHVLTGQHRSGGAIPRFVAGVRRGEYLPRVGSGVEVFVPAQDVSLAVDQILATWLHSVRERGVEHVALLLATRKGKAERAGLNVTHLNARAQALVNPPHPGTTVAGSQLRLGDRIVVRKNLVFLDPEAGDYRRLCNGDMGWLEEAIAVEDRFEAQTVDLVLQMDDGSRVRVPAAYCRALELGYALTCHSAQGSEFEHAIVALQGPGTAFQSRRMLYTACSRARELLTLFGSDGDLSSVAALATPERHSYLKEAALVEAEALAVDRGNTPGGRASIPPAAAPPAVGGLQRRAQEATLGTSLRALDPQDAPRAQPANDLRALAAQAAAAQR